MAENHNKRSLDDMNGGSQGGDEPYGQQPNKSARLPDRFDVLDPAVRDRVERLLGTRLLHQEDLDDRAVNALKEHPPQAAVDVLDQFERSLTNGNVHNKAAYLVGVCTRLKRFGHGPKLAKEVQNRIEQLYRSGKMKETLLDTKSLEAIADLDAPTALRVVDAFEVKDLEEARNVNALFMSTIKVVKEQSRGQMHPRDRDRPPYGAPPPGYGGPPPPHHAYREPPPPYGYAPAPYSPPRYGGPPPPAYGGAPPPYGAPAPYPPPQAPYGAPTPMPAPRATFTAEQAALGVRIDELHNLSPHAPFVPGPVAIALQRAWDSGNRLVSLLDEGSWKTLTELDVASGQQVVREVVEAMDTQQIRNCNAFLMAVAKKFMGGGAGGGDRYGGERDRYGGGGSYPRGGGERSDPSGIQKGVPALSKLSGPLAQRAQDLLAQHSHVLRDGHFDEVVVAQLQRLPEQEALDVLSEVGRHELVTVKNVPAYIMGIINRYKRGGGRPGPAF